MPMSWSPPSSSPTYLNVSYAEKDKAKALGARWDPNRRSWYAPAGLDPLIFETWLPAATRAELQTQNTRTSGGPGNSDLAPLRGIGLAELLRGVAQVVATSFNDPVWTRVEVINVNLSASGHVYLELTERSTTGQVLAKARGTLWSSVANRILPEFEQVTGVQLAPGIQLLVLAQPQFMAQYGFSVNISGIDLSYTLGRLEAHKRQIRQALQAEGIFERNRQLPAPWDFSRVMVLSPEHAAGLGDFVSDARRLQQCGVCEFVYVHSRFQGEGAAAEILRALQSALQTHPAETLDAIIIIRGGGAVNDLAWLNDLDLARFICLSSTPVLTGIGHERDSTILDEVAHHSYDTPSKVIAAIGRHIRERAAEATDSFAAIFHGSHEILRQGTLSVQRYRDQIRDRSRQTLQDAVHESARELSEIRLATSAMMHRARGMCHESISGIRADVRSQLRSAQQGVPATMNRIQDAARRDIKLARSELGGTLPSVLQKIQDQVAQAREASVVLRDAVFERSSTAAQDLRTETEGMLRTLLRDVAGEAGRARENSISLRDAIFERGNNEVRRLRTETEGLMREIAGQGPQKTLSRGFAIVRDDQGRPLMSASTAASAATLRLQFTDGRVAARVTQALHEPADTAPSRKLKAKDEQIASHKTK